MDGSVKTGRLDARAIGITGFAHFFSHFYQLTLPPLFVLINLQEGISFGELGLLISVFYGASGVSQTPAGFLVDRVGARRVLSIGLGMMACGMIALGTTPRYEIMLVAAIIAGVGNSVFHPADYSILSATVSESRMGRAYSVHNVTGFLGYACAPVVMGAAGAQWGWRSSVIVAGMLGIAGLLIILAVSSGLRDSRSERSETTPDRTRSQNVALIMSLPILLGFAFMMTFGMGQIGLQTFSPTVLEKVFAFPAGLATMAVTVMLVAVPFGILVGGLIAERTTQHDLTAGAAFAIAALFMLCLGLFDLPVPVIIACYLIAGFSYGVAPPSRDMVIRRTAPAGATGRVFGFVYTGLDFGSMCTPVLFGWLVDVGLPRTMYFCVAGLWFIGLMTIIASSRIAKRSPAERTA